MINKKAFTLIELLIIIAIIVILTVAVLVSINSARTKARVNSAKTTLKSALPAIIACKDGGGTVSNPTAGIAICAPNVGLNNAKWPPLASGYSYDSYNPATCDLKVNTASGDVSGNILTCNCVKQICE